MPELNPRVVNLEGLHVKLTTFEG